MSGTIKDFLIEHAESRPVSFHMPGHKGSALYRENGYGEFLDNIMDLDVTEIPGADNLFQPETTLRSVMDRYRRLYDVNGSYLLINGSSGGLIASILASVPRGGRLILARNCHKSIFNALQLGDIQPVYAYPRLIEDYGIAGEVTAEEVRRCLEDFPDAAAVILPSPNYYGICSDIAAIADEVHSRGKILIVDQAHGAHLKFFGKWAKGNSMPPAAEEQGADAVINSIHKTLGSFTQTAVLNLCSERIDRYTVEDKLQMIESSSPSYPLMSSLDINADLLEKKGRKLIEEWESNIEYFYCEAAKIPGLAVMSRPDLDATKLNLDMSACGIDGNQLEELLLEKNIVPELVTGNILMCMTGIGNKRYDYMRLIAALGDISETYGSAWKSGGENHGKSQSCAAAPTVAAAPSVRQPAKIPAETVRVPLESAADKVCAMSVIPYPPGIPLVCPGEVFTAEITGQIAGLRRAGGKVIGVDEKGRVVVGAEP